MIKECLICGDSYETKNKKSKYCSRECQYESYRKPKSNRIEKTCLNCGCNFKVKEYDISLGRGKYCSRLCKDNHQKKIYVGENNPMFGKKHSQETLKLKSEITKQLWSDENYRQKIKDGVKNYVEINGHHPGTDESSQRKRKNTMIKRYGIEHNWIGVYGERKCDKTTIEKYGKSSIEMLIEYEIRYGSETDIEKIFKNYLDELGIPYQFKFRIYNESKKPFWYREYDFLILESNILIEVDGDYWHGNPNTFKVLNECQIETKNKDKIKQKFAEDMGFEVIRFWGSDVKNDPNLVKEILFSKIKNN